MTARGVADDATRAERRRLLQQARNMRAKYMSDNDTILTIFLRNIAEPCGLPVCSAELRGARF
jgi:hypothetical protein